MKIWICIIVGLAKVENMMKSYHHQSNPSQFIETTHLRYFFSKPQNNHFDLACIQKRINYYHESYFPTKKKQFL